MLIKQKFRSFFSATFSGLPMSACGFSFFFFLFHVGAIRVTDSPHQGAKKDSFMACHLGKLLLVCTSPKMFFTSSIDYSSSAIWISQKRTEFISPIAKTTSPGLSDTTFFARCPFMSYYYYSPLKYMAVLFLTPVWLLGKKYSLTPVVMILWWHTQKEKDVVGIVTFHLISLLPTNHIMI